MSTQLKRFVAVGVFTAVIDYSLTMILDAVGVHRQLAKAIGWVFGTLAAYLLNSKYTFSSALSAKTATAVFLLYASTFAVQNFLWWVTEAPLEALGFEGAVKNTISFVIAQGVATLTNFFMQRTLIFRERR
ncbi:hypothetical protein C3B44_00575 [Corynebacterium yudongzhengii]|uniref:GtrA family protein n=1 Tax=Corynebacterium yudongzhengii TaxID=2080740 RepID=A0A2U1T5M1_9CORY|nr:hypothetical protein C3B44_00575 [Corynebacterium yudongzhengii]PWC01301.1 GtrA family protein [Corynebacterium yudongzhengii]